MLDSGSLPWQVRRGSAKLIGRDVGLEYLLRRHDVQVLSHQGFLGGLGKTPALGWIPDFQERHLPECFSEAEVSARTRKLALFSRVCSRVIISSYDAKSDLYVLDASCTARARVLQFVADVAAPSPEESSAVIGRLDIQRPYFHLPNQFWAHKNHGIVVEALRVLKTRGVNARVVASGNTADHRQPGSFDALMSCVREASVEDRFLTVGTVPYKDLVALMAGSVAVINPSRFEGWSTTVEEAKSLGKLVLLSDLRVHREQAPQRSCYFAPDDVEGLAKAMTETLVSHDPIVEERSMREAQESLPDRRQAFARAYEDIVVEAVA
jgi:glycosyltransferase involved in cell wall biosynthesis